MDIPKDDIRLDHIQAGDEYGGIKEGSPEQVAARPLMGFQAVTNGKDDVTFQTSQVSHWPSKFPAPVMTLSALALKYCCCSIQFVIQSSVLPQGSPQDKT